MGLTAVLPALMEGIAQEVGVDMDDLKVILVGDETQLDVKPFQTLREQYHQVECRLNGSSGSSPQLRIRNSLLWNCMWKFDARRMSPSFNLSRLTISPCLLMSKPPKYALMETIQSISTSLAHLVHVR